MDRKKKIRAVLSVLAYAAGIGLMCLAVAWRSPLFQAGTGGHFLVDWSNPDLPLKLVLLAAGLALVLSAADKSARDRADNDDSDKKNND